MSLSWLQAGHPAFPWGVFGSSQQSKNLCSVLLVQLSRYMGVRAKEKTDTQCCVNGFLGNLSPRAICAFRGRASAFGGTVCVLLHRPELGHSQAETAHLQSLCPQLWSKTRHRASAQEESFGIRTRERITPGASHKPRVGTNRCAVDRWRRRPDSGVHLVPLEV